MIDIGENEMVPNHDPARNIRLVCLSCLLIYLEYIISYLVELINLEMQCNYAIMQMLCINFHSKENN